MVIKKHLRLFLVKFRYIPLAHTILSQWLQNRAKNWNGKEYYSNRILIVEVNWLNMSMKSIDNLFWVFLVFHFSILPRPTQLLIFFLFFLSRDCDLYIMVFANQNFTGIKDVTKKKNLCQRCSNKKLLLWLLKYSYVNIRDLGHILRCRASLGACYF